ncbi:BTB/POZ protein [Rhizophagus irregularis DAOM 181602=DAOM 197198]|nr:BTB/POZ protein [Rhizophagus irregularis DAOM 181602=DAOM 197198]
MSSKFFERLSQNYIEILSDDEYYDVTIEVEIFQIILEYIYGGVISLNEHEPLEILKVLTAADELLLQELINYLQEYLIENKFEWIEQNFEYTHRISFQTNSLLKLQQFCTGFMAKSPKKIFESLSSEMFVQKVHPYRKLLKPQLYDELFKSYLDPNAEPSNNILLPRCKNIDVKGTGEILGGYNPLVWKSHNDGDYGKTKDSFIFSFKGENNFRDIVLSHVNNTDCALIYHNSCGPAFSSDLSLYVKEKDGLKRYNCYECKRYCYEKRIRDTRDEFLIEDYEVFQIIKKHDD